MGAKARHASRFKYPHATGMGLLSSETAGRLAGSSWATGITIKKIGRSAFVQLTGMHACWIQLLHHPAFACKRPAGRGSRACLEMPAGNTML